jgi:hypothetical protein
MRLVVAELIATVCSLPNRRRKFGLLALGPNVLQEFPCGTSLPECSGALYLELAKPDLRLRPQYSGPRLGGRDGNAWAN